MKIYKSTLLAALCAVSLISCDNDDDNGTDVVAPTTYSFERNGESSVSYSGQTDRIMMGEELLNGMKTPTTSLATLQARFDHQQGQNDFTNASLNSSSKSVRSKTAASSDYFSSNSVDQAAIRADFDAWISNQTTELFAAGAWTNTTASAGVAGKLQEAGGGSTRYFNAKGLEYNQAVAKGLIGALMTDQMLNNYLSTSVLDAGTNRADNDNGTLASGKNYTTMEHKWDEAFGYLYGTDNATSPALDRDEFLNKYLERTEGDADFTGIAQDIYDAFKLGRAAIVNGDYNLRDRQANIIREKVSTVIGRMAVFYLIEGKETRGTNMAGGLHDFSEGYGFVYSLQFTRKPNTNEPYFTKAEVDAFINTLESGNGLWDLTDAEIDTMAADIASRFDFTVAQAWR